MKKLNFIFTYVFLFSISFVQSQEENQNSKFSIIAYGGIGYTKVQNDLELDYDLNVNTAEILINYKIWNDIGIASGIGYSELSGAGYNSTGNFYHERNVVKIPLLLTANKNFSENLVIFANFGFYGQTIVKDEFRYLLTTRDDIYEGLNFGAQLGLGLGYQIDERFAG